MSSGSPLTNERTVPEKACPSVVATAGAGGAVRSRGASPTLAVLATTVWGRGQGRSDRRRCHRHRDGVVPLLGVDVESGDVEGRDVRVRLADADGGGGGAVSPVDRGDVVSRIPLRIGVAERGDRAVEDRALERRDGHRDGAQGRVGDVHRVDDADAGADANGRRDGHAVGVGDDDRGVIGPFLAVGMAAVDEEAA